MRLRFSSMCQPINTAAREFCVLLGVWLTLTLFAFVFFGLLCLLLQFIAAALGYAPPPGTPLLWWGL